MSSAKDFLTQYTKKIIHNPMDRHKILQEGIAELEGQQVGKTRDTIQQIQDIQADHTLPITIGFDHSMPPAGWFQFGGGFALLPNPEEYFIAPAANYDKQTGKWEIVGYSFVHVSLLPNAEQLREKLEQAKS